MIGDALVDVKEVVVGRVLMDVLAHVQVAVMGHAREPAWEVVKGGVPVVAEAIINPYEFC